MKKYFIPFLCVLSGWTAAGQVLNRSAVIGPSPGKSVSPPTIVSRGPHQRVWQTVSVMPNEIGVLTTNVSAYTELANGMSYQDPKTGQWKDAVPVFEIVGQNAVASQTGHKVTLLGNANSPGAVTLVMPDGQNLVSHVVGLSFFDRGTGKSVQVATVQDSVGQLIGPNNNQVVYPDIFKEVSCDLVYTLTRAGLEQDIVVRERLPFVPEDFGLSSDTTLLEVATEFEKSPQSTLATSVIKAEADPQARAILAEPDIVDSTISFGTMRIGPGRAFQIRNDAAADPLQGFIPVSKSWDVVSGRTFLFESVELATIKDALATLPAKQQANAKKPGSPQQLASTKRALSAPPEARSSQDTILVAQSAPARKGLILDYIILQTITDFVFRADTTYLCVGPVSISGTTWLEGGTVVKSIRDTNNNRVYVELLGPVICLTDMYRPAVFTSKDDDTIGERISAAPHTSTGTPIGTYAQDALKFSNTGTIIDVSNIRVRNAYVGLAFYYGGPHTARNVQAVNCGFLAEVNSSGLNILNALCHQASVAVVITYGSAVIAQHLTADAVNQMVVTNAVGTLAGTLAVYNCLVVQATNGSSYILDAATVILASGSGVFQTVGAGAHYLSDNSVYRNAATSAIDPTLAVDLKKKTTYPPIILTTNVTVNTALAPQVPRDTHARDLGYHYDPIDYAVNAIQIQNATLTLTNGVALAAYGLAGLELASGGVIISRGTPTARNKIVRYLNVQEQALDWGNAASYYATYSILPYGTETSPRTVDLRFTDFMAINAASTNTSFVQTHRHFLSQNDPNYSVTTVKLQDCEFYNCYTYFGGNAQNTLAVNNVLFCEGGNFFQDYLTLSMYNTLHVSGYTGFLPLGSIPWVVNDNLFYCNLQTNTTPVSSANNGYSAYLTSSGQILPGAVNSVTNLDFDFPLNTSYVLTNRLGRYYYPATGGANSLANLINHGSRAAGLAGLYHYTTQTNQTKEASSQVDIGYHYVAVDSNGKPIDTDGDGSPDYYEDSNGNGTFESGAGETDWQTSSVWYASPTGLAGNTGAIGSPWDLQTALNKTATIQPGDTLYLRDGIYTHAPQSTGPDNEGYIFEVTLSGTAIAPITIRSFLGEHARLDGGDVPFVLTDGTDHAVARPTLLVGGDGRIGTGSSLTIGANIIVQDIEFFSSSTQTRFSTGDSSFPLDITRSTGLMAQGKGVKIINCVFHDLSSGIESFASSSMGHEYYGNVLFNNGWQGTPHLHGHNFYLQGPLTTTPAGLIKLVKRNLSTAAYDKGVQAYGSGTSTEGHYHFLENVWLGAGTNGHGNVLLGMRNGTNANRIVDAQFINNFGYNANLSLYFQADPIAYLDLLATGNYFYKEFLQSSSWKNLTFTNNYLFNSAASVVVSSLFTNDVFLPWDFNRNFYWINPGPATNVATNVWKIETLAPMTFPIWKSKTGYDADSIVSHTLPNTNYVILQDNIYDVNRAQVAVYNWSGGTNIVLDVVPLGWVTGDPVTIRNLQDYYGDSFSATVSATRKLNLDMRAASHTLAIPYGDSAALCPASFPDFGAFILQRSP